MEICVYFMSSNVYPFMSYATKIEKVNRAIFSFSGNRGELVSAIKLVGVKRVLIAINSNNQIAFYDQCNRYSCRFMNLWKKYAMR